MYRDMSTHMSVYIFTHVHVFIHVYVYMPMHICIRMDIYTYVYIRTCICICIGNWRCDGEVDKNAARKQARTGRHSVCDVRNVCVCVCVCVRVRVSVCLCTCVRAFGVLYMYTLQKCR